MAEPISFGQGIARQYSPKDYTNLWSREFAMQENRDLKKALLKAKKQEEDDKALAKILNDDFKVDPTKYHPKFLPFVYQASRESVKKILAAKEQNPDNYQNLVPEIINEWGKEVNLQFMNSKHAFASEQADKGKVYTSDENKRALSANYGDLTDLKNDPINGAYWNPDTRTFTFEPNAKLKTEEIRKSTIWNDDDLKTEPIPITVRTAPNGQKIETTGKKVPDLTVSALASGLLNDRDYSFNIIHEYADDMQRKETPVNIPEDFKTNKDFLNEVTQWHDKKAREENRAKTQEHYLAFPPQETEASKRSKPQVSGNTVTLGNAKWTYQADGNKEIWTPARTDVTENKVFDFEASNGKTISGRIKNIVSEKGGVPVINIITKEKRKEVDTDNIIDVEVEKTVPYGTKNAGNVARIKNEYNADPYMIRKLVTGSLEVPKGEIVGTTATGVKSNTGGGKTSTKPITGLPQDMTPDEWNEEWSLLPKGSSMFGLDGKIYVKK